MRWASVAAGSHGDLARIGLSVRNELWHRLCWKGRIDHHAERRTTDARDRCNVAHEIEIQPIVECCVDRARCSNYEERVAVRYRLHDSFRSDIGGGSRPVFNDEWLAKPLRQRLSDEPRQRIGPT